MSLLRSNDFKCFEGEDNTESDKRIDNHQDNSHEAFITGLSQLLVSGKTFIGKESKDILIEIRYPGNYNQLRKTNTFDSVNIVFSG